MTPADLKRGDVLLAATQSPLAGMLRMLDGAKFDFAGIFSGHEDSAVLCTGPEGVVSLPLQKLLSDSETVEVFRFRSDDGKSLDDPVLPSKPIFDKLRYFTEKSERLSNETVVHVALAAVTRRPPVHGWLSGLSLIFDQILDPAIAAMDQMILAGRTPVSASGFVHRTFSETGLKYRLRFPGVRTLTLDSPAALARAAYKRALIGNPDALGAVDADLLRLHAKLQVLYGRHYSALLTDPVSVTSEEGDLLPPEIVTARDLADSPNLLRVGLLH